MRTIIIYNALATALIALSPLAANVAHGAAHEYLVQVDKDMRHMHVEARFGQKIDTLSARSRDAGRFLTDVRNCDDDERIRVNGRRMSLPNGGTSCIHYNVNLVEAAKAERRNATLAAANIIVSPAVWFWRPATRDDDRITIRFELDDSVQVSVPWQPVSGQPDTYRPKPSPESSTAPAAFGDFEYHERQIPGALLRITVLKSTSEFDTKAIVAWVVAAAGNVALAYGQFPNPSPSVIVLPVGASGWSNSPVPFGRVVRDGGESIELFINEGMPIDAYYDDWTATHEFSHLMLPYISSRHRWISEGFAQYYQNLLLARAGQYTEQRTWQKLYEGFERGRTSSPDMTPNEAAVGDRRAATMKIYWTGAALALFADVQLRERSDGEESLDFVLQQLQQCCLPAEDMWSGTRLFAKLDTFLDEPLFMPLYRRHANAAGFPEVRPLLTRLGVVVENDVIRLNQGAELAPLRASMTGR
ncbi:MAG: hypothetical protein OER97_07620 [Gammaproteobacteria bacterium]|nr:hypothetical protein [Gammaproteobacteria bacterium]